MLALCLCIRQKPRSSHLRSRATRLGFSEPVGPSRLCPTDPRLTRVTHPRHSPLGDAPGIEYFPSSILYHEVTKGTTRSTDDLARCVRSEDELGAR